MPPNSNGWIAYGLLTDGGRTVKAGGPLGSIGPAVESVEVRTVITQYPGPDRPNGDDSRAPTATGTSEVSGREFNSANPWWEFTASRVKNGPFDDGWARATAVALIVWTNGEIETRSWSRWIWLDRDAAYYENAESVARGLPPGANAGGR
jgi:hypothetical protein